MRLGLVAVAGLAFGLLAACGSDTDDLERRIAALEAQPQIGDLIVVGKDIKANAIGFATCVRYRAFGSVEETCAPFGPDATSAGQQCLDDAKVGEPLPDSCR